MTRAASGKKKMGPLPEKAIFQLAATHPGAEFEADMDQLGLVRVEKTGVFWECGRCGSFNAKRIKNRAVVLAHFSSCRGSLLLDWNPFPVATATVPLSLVVVAADAFLCEVRHAYVASELQAFEERILTLSAHTSHAADGVFYYSAFKTAHEQIVIRYVESGVYRGSFQALRKEFLSFFGVDGPALLGCRVYTELDLIREVRMLRFYWGFLI
jgi:hypothetical protein